MGLFHTVGKGMVKGAKFVMKHREELKEAANVVADAASQIEGGSAPYEKAYRSALAKENERLRAEIKENIARCKDRIHVLEAKEILSSEALASLQEETNKLNGKVDMMAEAQARYQKKANIRFWIVTVLGFCGIAAAVAIALML